MSEKIGKYLHFILFFSWCMRITHMCMRGVNVCVITKSASEFFHDKKKKTFKNISQSTLKKYLKKEKKTIF